MLILKTHTVCPSGTQAWLPCSCCKVAEAGGWQSTDTGFWKTGQPAAHMALGENYFSFPERCHTMFFDCTLLRHQRYLACLKTSIWTDSVVSWRIFQNWHWFHQMTTQWTVAQATFQNTAWGWGGMGVNEAPVSCSCCSWCLETRHVDYNKNMTRYRQKQQHTGKEERTTLKQDHTVRWKDRNERQTQWSSRSSAHALLRCKNEAWCSL